MWCVVCGSFSSFANFQFQIVADTDHKQLRSSVLKEIQNRSSPFPLSKRLRPGQFASRRGASGTFSAALVFIARYRSAFKAAGRSCSICHIGICLCQILGFGVTFAVEISIDWLATSGLATERKGPEREKLVVLRL